MFIGGHEKFTEVSMALLVSNAIVLTMLAALRMSGITLETFPTQSFASQYSCKVEFPHIIAWNFDILYLFHLAA